MTTKKTLPSKPSKVAAKKPVPAAKPVEKAKPLAEKPAAKVKAQAKAAPAKADTKAVAKAKPAAAKAVAKEKAKAKAAPAKATPKPAVKEKATKVAKKDKKTPTKTLANYKKTALSAASKISGIEKNNVFIPLKPSVAKITTPKKEAPIKEVKIPKITAKESIPYNPGYTPLEKRLTTRSAETFTKYSDSELIEFKELILRKLEAAKKELNYFQGLITRKDEQSGGTEEGRYLTMDDGGISMEREQLSQMASRAITYTDHLEKALLRIENKTYGVCRVTGKLIDKARLRAVPHATLSYEAKQGLVKQETTND